MKKNNLNLLFLFVLIFNFSYSSPKDGDLYKLTIFHTNDWHGNLNQLPKYSSIIKKVKSETENVLVMDGGDLFLRGEFEEHQGEIEVELLNKMGYDYWVPGNNDFRVPNKSKQTSKEANRQLSNIINNGKFESICANVKFKDEDTYLPNVKPYSIKNINGLRIATIGITSMKPQTRNWNEVSDKVFVNGDEIIQDIVLELKEKSDINIVLSHAGIVTDVKMAGKFYFNSEISAVLGADDHFILDKPMHTVRKDKDSKIKTTPITQAGGEAEHFLGRLDLTYKYENGKWNLDDFEGKLYDITDVKEDQKIKNILEKYRDLKANKIAA